MTQKVVIETIKPQGIKCDLCGKPVPIGRLMVGGPFKVLCKSCAILANKAIDAYIKMISRNPLLWFAKSVVTHNEESQGEKKQ